MSQQPHLNKVETTSPKDSPNQTWMIVVLYKIF